MCLHHYKYNTESVINAVLESTLPPNLQELSVSSNHVPPEPVNKINHTNKSYTEILNELCYSKFKGPSAVNNFSQAIEKSNTLDNNQIDQRYQINKYDLIYENLMYIHQKCQYSSVFTFRKGNYENYTEIYNDKTEIKKLSHIYNKYSYVTEDYEDEYDDTYDSHNIGASVVDDIFEAEYRPFQTPRVN